MHCGRSYAATWRRKYKKRNEKRRAKKDVPTKDEVNSLNDRSKRRRRGVDRGSGRGLLGYDFSWSRVLFSATHKHAGRATR